MISTSFFFIFKHVQGIKICKSDSDCWTKSRPDVHSDFCVNNYCQKLVGPGKRCTMPTECASYYYYGPIACSAKCSVETECEYRDIIKPNSFYCCKAVPEGKECISTRPSMLNGCALREGCVMNKMGDYVCESSTGGGWLVGVVLSINGNVFINVGLNVQKRSYRMPHTIICGFNMSTFGLGIIFYVIGKISGFSSYIFGNQSLLASLGAIGLISNSVFAPLINEEVFTWKDLSAIVFVLTGSSLIVMNSGRGHRVFGLCELLKMYQRTGTILWFSLITFLILGLFFTVKFVEINSEWAIPCDSFIFLQRDDTFYDEDSNVLKYYMVLFYVGLSAVIASLTTLFAKSFGEMIDKTLNGDNQFLFGITYLFFALVIVCTTLQIIWLNRALKRYDALLIIPIFHVIWTLFSVITAGIYFQDFEHYSFEQFKGFTTGLFIIFTGSLFLGLRIINKGYIQTEPLVISRTTVSK